MNVVQQARTQPGQVRKEAAIHASTCVYHFSIMSTIKDETYYMRLAIKEAEKAALKDEVPVGAVLVCDGKVIARAHNLKEHHQQATSHAELLAINKASKKRGSWHLEDCDLYVTLEPCMMCMGALNMSRIRTVYYGTTDPKFGAADSMLEYRLIKGMNKHPNIVSGILQEECADLLSTFFKNKRIQKKNQ